MGGEIYQGNSKCKFWKGVRDSFEHECCGGKKMTVMVIFCEKRNRLVTAVGNNEACTVRCWEAELKEGE